MSLNTVKIPSMRYCKWLDQELVIQLHSQVLVQLDYVKRVKGFHNGT